MAATDCSGLVALIFGGDDIQGEVGTSAVDLYVAAGPAAAPGTDQQTVEMPQDGCVRGLSIVLETKVTSEATLAVTLDGTEDTTAVKVLAANATTGSATFSNYDMTFKKNDGLGVSLTGSAGGAVLIQGVSVVLLVQYGRSGI